jgi:hypothetical protein
MFNSGIVQHPAFGPTIVGTPHPIHLDNGKTLSVLVSRNGDTFLTEAPEPGDGFPNFISATCESIAHGITSTGAFLMRPYYAADDLTREALVSGRIIHGITFIGSLIAAQAYPGLVVSPVMVTRGGKVAKTYEWTSFPVEPSYGLLKEIERDTFYSCDCTLKHSYSLEIITRIGYCYLTQGIFEAHWDSAFRKNCCPNEPDQILIETFRSLLFCPGCSRLYRKSPVRFCGVCLEKVEGTRHVDCEPQWGRGDWIFGKGNIILKVPSFVVEIVALNGVARSGDLEITQYHGVYQLSAPVVTNWNEEARWT